ncbi:MAG TPA: hypothetical protein PLB25_19685 [Rhodoferax sp.]|nr:hypothetical protein [Rhodoferax sp.]
MNISRVAGSRSFCPSSRIICRLGRKNVRSKDILKRIAVDIARLLLHLQADSAEIIDTECHRMEDRCADLVAQNVRCRWRICPAQGFARHR